MKRLRELNRYQQAILLLLAAMVLVFTVLYPIISARNGFAYRDALLIPRQEGGNTVYAGRIDGEEARFTVREDGSVEFRYGDAVYGPYTAREDPTAIPEEHELAGSMTGVELRRGEEIVFRGGVLDGDFDWLYREDGSLESSGIVIDVNGVRFDENGKVIDPMEPAPSSILELIAGPALSHRGNWTAWLLGTLFCGITAIDLLFADELFRWRMAFRVQDPEDVEPSDWEIAGRYVGWTVLPAVALFLFVAGLL